MTAAAPTPGRHNDLTDVAGIRVGHHQRRGRGWLTGTTVVLAPPGTVGGVDVRGGGPSSRETDALSPTTLVDVVHAVVLSGGSSYGLAAASGVAGWLGERGVGFPVGPAPDHVVPIVPAACLFDLHRGGRFDHWPDESFGRAAADSASGRKLAQGSVGAGTGARAGSVKGGLGSASVVLPSGVTVAALVAVNPGGSVVDPATGVLYGARQLLPEELPGLRRPSAADARRVRAEVASDAGGPGGQAPPGHRSVRNELLPTPVIGNTTLAVVATDAALAKPECTRLAIAAHDGLARAIQPVHAMTDGDIAFALATGHRPIGQVPAGPGGLGAARPTELSGLMAAAADAVARAIVHALVAARSAPAMPSYVDRYPSAWVSV